MEGRKGQGKDGRARCGGNQAHGIYATSGGGHTNRTTNDGADVVLLLHLFRTGAMNRMQFDIQLRQRVRDDAHTACPSSTLPAAWRATSVIGPTTHPGEVGSKVDRLPRDASAAHASAASASASVSISPTPHAARATSTMISRACARRATSCCSRHLRRRVSQTARSVAHEPNEEDADIHT